jgi:DNA-binding LacI/PurR family transcriptional regulator
MNNPRNDAIGEDATTATATLPSQSGQEIILASRPKYRILQDLIRAGIRDGTLTDNTAKLPSEHDMARNFGVAYMTVRTAVNELVTEGLLQRVHGKGTFVRQAMNGNNETASALPKVRELALAVPSLPSLWNVAGLYYFPGIVQGFCTEATRLGYEPTVIGRAKDALASASGDLTRAAAGMACLLVTREDSETVEALRDLSVPVVGINRYLGRRTIPFIAADQEKGMREAVYLLAAQGHKRIAFLPGPTGNQGAGERLRGFKRAVAALKLGSAEIFTEETEIPAAYTEISGVTRARILLDRPTGQRPTAIVTAGDLIAAGVYEAARERGLSVPGDLSVIGYGDFQIASYLQPALTTVRLPLEGLGAEAARVLHEQVSGVTAQSAVILPTTLVTRDSVAGITE